MALSEETGKTVDSNPENETKVKLQTKKAKPVAEDTLLIKIKLPSGEVSRIPLVRANETVLNLKQLILDIPELCHFSSCHLEAIQSSGSGKKKKKQSDIALDDHKTLEECPEILRGDILKIVPDLYNFQGVVDQIKRFRYIIANPPVPFLEDNVEEVEAEAEPENGVAGNVKTDSADTEKKQPLSGPENDTSSTNISEGSIEPEMKKTDDIHEQQKEQKEQKEQKALQARHKEMLKNLREEIIPIPVSLNAFYPGEEQDKAGLLAETNSGVQWKDDPQPSCFRSIDFSGWNPPPKNRRLLGDLAYLEVRTAGGDTGVVLHVTATAKGFYVNSTRNQLFNPEPSHSPCHSHTLVELLQKASPTFKKNYTGNLKKAAENAKNITSTTALNEYDIVTLGFTAKPESAMDEQGLQQNQWALPVQRKGNHTFDFSRANERLHDGYGIVGVERGMLRDWNDDYQSCIEMPCTTIEEKILRCRAIDRVQKDFVDAATKAVQGIVEGHIPPINPADPPHAHVYVYNQIFFSLAKLESYSTEPKQSVGKPGQSVESAVASYSASNHDLQGVRSLNESMEVIRAMDNLSKASTPEEEKSTEGSSPDDTCDDNPTSLHTLATVIVDYLGQRVIAQSIIPGILQSDHNQLLVYGSVDYGKAVKSDAEVEKVWKRAVKPWFIGESRVGKEEEVSLYAPVESKGIKGSDSRIYALDLLRLTPFDLNYYEKRKSEFTNSSGEIEIQINSSSTYVALLRPELIQLYARWREYVNQQKQINEYREKMKKKKEEESTKESDKDNEAKPSEQEDEVKIKLTPLPPLSIDLNVFTSFEQPEGEDKASARETVRELARYLKDIRIPQLIEDIRKGIIPIADGKTLTQAVHSNGINMRYISDIAKLSFDSENVISRSETTFLPPMPECVFELCEIEMIARSVKWIIRKERRKNVNVSQSPAAFIASVLNDVFQSSSNATWSAIKNHLKEHYDNYEMKIWGPSASMRERGYPLPLLRRICQVCGIVVSSRDFTFYDQNQKLKKDIFQAQDIADIVPVVKSSIPEWPIPEARDCLEAAKIQLSKKDFVGACERANEALSLVTQVTGSAHLTVATCCSFIGTILHHLNDPASALISQRRALALLDRVGLLDTAQVAHAHNNVGMLYHSVGQTDLAIPHLRRSLYLLELIGGRTHAEASALYLKMATVYTQAGLFKMGIQSVNEALLRSRKNQLQQALCRRSLAHIFAIHGNNFQQAFSQEKLAYDIYKQLLGPKHARTVEVSQWMEVYLRKNLQQKEAQEKLQTDVKNDTEKAKPKQASKKNNKKNKNKKKR